MLPRNNHPSCAGMILLKLPGDPVEFVNAKNYFDVTNGPPVYRRNDLGPIGDPFVIPKLYDGRGKTHFFFSEEARLEKTRQRSGRQCLRWPSGTATSAMFAPRRPTAPNSMATS